MGRPSSSRVGPGDTVVPGGAGPGLQCSLLGTWSCPSTMGVSPICAPPGPSPSPSQVSNRRDRLSASSDHSGYCWVASSLPLRPDHRHVPQRSPAQRAHICPHRCPCTRGQGHLHTSAQSWETHSGTRHGCILSQSGKRGIHAQDRVHPTDLPKLTQTGQDQAPLHQEGGRDPPPGPAQPHSSHTATALPPRAQAVSSRGCLVALPFPSSV